MPILTSEAIVLRVMDYSETSLIVWLYSRDHGRLHLIAKGARRARSTFEGALEPLVRGEISFYRKKRASEGLEIAKEFDPLDLHIGLRRNLPRLYRGLYLGELLTELSEREAPSPESYDAASEGLAGLSRGEVHTLDGTLLRAELRLLQEAGLAPRLRTCTCERPADLDGAGALWFSAPSGGLLCPDHAKADPAARHVPRAAIKVLDGLGAAPAPVLPHVADDLRDVMDRFVSHHLGKQPRLQRYLRQREVVRG